MVDSEDNVDGNLHPSNVSTTSDNPAIMADEALPSLNELQNSANPVQGSESIELVQRTPAVFAQEQPLQSNMLDSIPEHRGDLIETGSPHSIPRNLWSTAPLPPTSPFQSFDNNKLYLFLASCYLLCCVATAGWILATGPKEVPQQDTRITNAIISILSRIALTLAIWILTVLLRIQWTKVLVSGRLVKLRGLLVSCGDTGNLSRVRYLHLMPTIEIGATILIGLGVTICMTLTSAGFKYVVISGTDWRPFVGPDFQALCNYSLINASTGYFCGGNTNNINTQWSYLDAVNSGAGGNVVKSGNATSGRLSANVTLTSAPANIRLPSNPAPPWAAIDVGCRSVDLELQLNGTDALSVVTVMLNGVVFDHLSIANMPTWASQIQLYQQVNDTGPASSLAPYYIMLLARDLVDQTSNTKGLAGSAVQYLGNFYLDLHGWGPTVQGVLGAAVYCDFGGSTGGSWPDISWPARNTTNYFVGPGPENGMLGVSTLLLNYGPSWQYTPISGNSIPGGTVSYIANFTTDEAPTFPIFITTYIRNQWALMTYSNNFIPSFMKNTSYEVWTEPTIHIQATAILAVPLVSLVFCIGCAITSVFMMKRGFGGWYKYVDNAPWWLMKALNATPGLGDREVNENEFKMWAGQRNCWYEVDSQHTERRAVLNLQ